MKGERKRFDVKLQWTENDFVIKRDRQNSIFEMVQTSPVALLTYLD